MVHSNAPNSFTVLQFNMSSGVETFSGFVSLRYSEDFSTPSRRKNAAGIPVEMTRHMLRIAAYTVKKLNIVSSNAALPGIPVRRSGEWGSANVPETPFLIKASFVISTEVKRSGEISWIQLLPVVTRPNTARQLCQDLRTLTGWLTTLIRLLSGTWGTTLLITKQERDPDWNSKPAGGVYEQCCLKIYDTKIKNLMSLFFFNKNYFWSIRKVHAFLNVTLI